MEDIDFVEGSLDFKIPGGTMDYRDNKFIYLINYTHGGSYLRIVKNKNNGLKIAYRFDDFGKCELEVNAEDLDNEHEHKVEVKWSIKEGFVKLFIDGVERGSNEMEISSV